MGRNFEMSPGLMDLKKNISFYLTLQKVAIWGSNCMNSAIMSSTGLDFSLKPFARMCAKYLL
jgi:hypothetical protein